mmetsp:Transcript_59125/g.141187  ORF Transcript_59125/g.141187 Transcript_59125/m.141187 type:complete len:293 (-) Transcript_59125:46-924(-)
MSEQVPDAREHVVASIRAWLAEQKRLPDYREVLKDVEGLIGKLRTAKRTTNSCSPTPGDVHQSLPTEDGKGAEGGKHEQDATAGDDQLASAAQGQVDSTPSPGPPNESVAGGSEATLRAGTEVALRMNFKDGICIKSLSRSTCATPTSPAYVDLWLSAQTPGRNGGELTMAEFHGLRSIDFRVDEAKYNVDFEVVQSLQVKMAPLMPRPIVFLDMLLALPLAEPDCPVPFRLRMLEDMLDQECWEEEENEDEADELAELSLAEDAADGDGICELQRVELPSIDRGQRKRARR